MENTNLDKKVLRTVLREMDMDIKERAKELSNAETRLRIAQENRIRLQIALDSILESEDE